MTTYQLLVATNCVMKMTHLCSKSHAANLESNRDGTGLSCCVQSLMLQLMEPLEVLQQGLPLALVGCPNSFSIDDSEETL